MKTKIFFLLILSFFNLKTGTLEFLPEEITNQSENYFLYSKAIRLHLNNQLMQALHAYNNLFNNHKKPSDFSYYGYILALFDSKQFDKIVGLKDKILKTFSTDWKLHLILADSLLITNNKPAADNIFKNLIQKFPNNEQVAYFTVVYYLKTNQIGLALQFLEKCTQKESLKNKHFLFHFLKSKVYLQTGMLKESLQAVEESLKLQPDFDKSLLLKAILQEQLGQTDKAVENYQDYLNKFGYDENITKQLTALLLKQKKYSQAANILEKLNKKSPEFYFDLALINWLAKSYEKAENYITKVLELNNNFKKAKKFKFDILLAQNKKQESLKFIYNWLKEKPNDSKILDLTFSLKNLGFNINNIIQVIEKGADKNNIEAQKALADLYFYKKDYKNSLNYCKKILEKTDNKKLKSKVLSQIAYINQLSKIEK